MQKIGFLGMGVMGLPMAKNVVQKCGLPVLGYDVVQQQMDAFREAGGIPVSDPAEIYKACDVILQILPTHPIIRNSVEQAIQYGKPGNVIVDLSSTAPDIILELYQQAKDAGMFLLDSPVSGGNPMAIAGTLAIMTGGDKEAFDKVARAIGLGYPGGPKIEKVSHEGDPHSIEFPRAKIVGGVYDFSFSGLKSAVLNYLNGCRMKGLEINQADVAASFQQAVTDVLVGHAENAIDEFKMDKFAIAGGVASNGVIRHAMEEMCARKGVKFYRPSPILCTDNAAMIGAAAYYDFIAGKRSGLDLNAVPNLKLGE